VAYLPPVSVSKSLACDTAFQLLYLILHAQPGDETKDKMKLFNAVMFVVSHPRTFKYRTKWATTSIARSSVEVHLQPISGFLWRPSDLRMPRLHRIRNTQTRTPIPNEH
jgi:hypothetical protein